MAKASSADAKSKAIDDVLKLINKEIKSEISDEVISKFGDKPRSVPTIPTGSLVLDSILGGGFAEGRVIELFGPEASGKTSFALTAVGNVQKKGGVAAFLDVEHALDPYYAETLGVDMDNLLVSQPEYAEQALNLMLRLINSDVVDVIVLDSIAALIPKSEYEGNFEDQSIGLLARVLSKALRRIAADAAKKGVTCIFINQVRAAIGGFSPMGTPETTTGGNAMKFTASQRVRIAGSKQIMEGKEAIGKNTTLIVKKNKIAPPGLRGETVLTFAEGINQAAELIEVGPKFGVIEKPNNVSYIEKETGEKIASGKANAIARLKEDKEMFDRLSKAFKEAVTESVMKRRGGGAHDPKSDQNPELPAVDKTADEIDELED